MERFKKLNEMLGDTETAQGITSVIIDNLIPFDKHPFKLYDKMRMSLLKQSITDNGVITPIIIRPAQRGKYIILAGHNRVEACKQLKITDIPSIIKYDISDDDAMLIVVESNLYQRSITEMLPSELAKALKIQMDILKCQGKRNDLTNSPVGEKSQDKVAEKNKLSPRSVQRYIRLNYLNQEFLDMVDLKQVSFRVAVELSYLESEQQSDILALLQDTGNMLTMSNMTQIKEIAQNKAWDKNFITSIFNKEIKQKIPNNYKCFKKIIPATDWDKTEEIITEALKMYYNM